MHTHMHARTHACTHARMHTYHHHHPHISDANINIPHMHAHILPQFHSRLLNFILLHVAAVVLRLSKSWFRIGSLEILHYSREYMLLKELVDFIIEDQFPWIGRRDRFFVSVYTCLKCIFYCLAVEVFCYGCGKDC